MTERTMTKIVQKRCYYCNLSAVLTPIKNFFSYLPPN